MGARPDLPKHYCVTENYCTEIAVKVVAQNPNYLPLDNVLGSNQSTDVNATVL